MNTDKTKLARMKTNWITPALANHKAGALHSDLGVPLGKKIPLTKEKAAAKGNSTTAKRARLAITLRKLNG